MEQEGEGAQHEAAVYKTAAEPEQHTPGVKADRKGELQPTARRRQVLALRWVEDHWDCKGKQPCTALRFHEP